MSARHQVFIASDGVAVDALALGSAAGRQKVRLRRLMTRTTQINDNRTAKRRVAAPTRQVSPSRVYVLPGRTGPLSGTSHRARVFPSLATRVDPYGDRPPGRRFAFPPLRSAGDLTAPPHGTTGVTAEVDDERRYDDQRHEHDEET